ncbi:MAG: carbohydrate ABC transporter permease [Candidatus Omnitrophota bacterium]|nr:MAG: carbohydrate ABC transporter permease [Candidatus Omnitrophota bacterium]
MKRHKEKIKRIVLALALVLVISWVIFPLYIMVKISVSSPQEVMTQHPSFLIKDFTPDHWQKVLSGQAIRGPLTKSLAVATISMIITLGIGIPAAYGISHLPKRWGYLALIAIFFTRMFPEVGIALPIAIKFLEWNLLDTNIGLALAHVIRVLPIACWILVGTFQTIPRELEEQAQIDGATKKVVLQRIVLPLSMGGISVAAIFSWLFSWDEFTYALYLCLAQPTLPLKIYYYITRGSWFLTATYATIITIPVVIITYSLQRFLKAGYTAGALKG